LTLIESRRYNQFRLIESRRYNQFRLIESRRYNQFRLIESRRYKQFGLIKSRRYNQFRLIESRRYNQFRLIESRQYNQYIRCAESVTAALPFRLRTPDRKATVEMAPPNARLQRQGGGIHLQVSQVSTAVSVQAVVLFCDTVQPGRWEPTFRTNMQSPSGSNRPCRHRHVPPKRQYPPTRLHGVTTENHKLKLTTICCHHVIPEEVGIAQTV
jgi:hypothetical protein